MIVYDSGILFKVMGEEVRLYSEEFEHRYNTVAEINHFFHHMGNEPNSISTAIFAWQEVKGRDLTTEELRQVMIDNGLLSDMKHSGE
jgi:hypothetical protein